MEHYPQRKLIACFSSAYEVWGSPETLNKEKQKQAKVRQQQYEGNAIVTKKIEFFYRSYSFTALFNLKKSWKEYEKRLSILENASFDNNQTVS